MKCPNCNKKFFYLFKIDHDQNNNWRRGFRCPYCRSILKIGGIKENAFVVLILIIVVYFLIKIVERYNDILTQNFYLAGLSYLIPILLGFFSIFYFIEYCILLNVEEKASQSKKVEKEKYTQKAEQQAKKIGSSFLLCAIIIAGVAIYKNSMEIFILTSPSLTVLGGWVWLSKGRKGSLVSGLFLALLTTGVCMWFLISYF